MTKSTGRTVEVTPRAFIRDAAIGVLGTPFQATPVGACTAAHGHRHSYKVTSKDRLPHEYTAPPSPLQAEQKATARLNKALKSIIKAPKDGIMIFTIYSMVHAAGSEFTRLLHGSSWLYGSVLDPPWPRSWWASPFPSLSFVSRWVPCGTGGGYVKHGVLSTM